MRVLTPNSDGANSIATSVRDNYSNTQNKTMWQNDQQNQQQRRPKRRSDFVNRGRIRRRRMSDIECYNCYKKWHIARDCWHNRAYYSNCDFKSNNSYENSDENKVDENNKSGKNYSRRNNNNQNCVNDVEDDENSEESVNLGYLNIVSKM